MLWTPLLLRVDTSKFLQAYRPARTTTPFHHPQRLTAGSSILWLSQAQIVSVLPQTLDSSNLLDRSTQIDS